MRHHTVEVAPVVGDEVLGIGGIVTARHAARVVVHADQVVDQRLVPAGPETQLDRSRFSTGNSTLVLSLARENRDWVINRFR